MSRGAEPGASGMINWLLIRREPIYFRRPEAGRDGARLRARFATSLSGDRVRVAVRVTRWPVMEWR
jgi:hypothetical protein